MGLQKYRFDGKDAPDANGAVRLYSTWMGGRTTAGVRNCPCGDYGRRTVYTTGEPDTWFSIPAAIMVRRKRINGWISCEDGQFEFHPCQSEA
jgi:hypothetical protein